MLWYRSPCPSPVQMLSGKSRGEPFCRVPGRVGLMCPSRIQAASIALTVASYLPFRFCTLEGRGIGLGPSSILEHPHPDGRGETGRMCNFQLLIVMSCSLPS